MNYSRKLVQERAKRLKSPSAHRKSKIHIIGVRLSLVLFVFFMCISISATTGILKSILASAPDINRIQVVPQGYTTTLTDNAGNTIQTLVGKNANREYVTLDQIPSSLQNAFIAIEDERFFEHNGIDLRGIARAFVTGIENGGAFSQGASTLTQQLLKNQVFGGGDETSFIARLERKIQEQYLAIQLEQKYDKKQILEYYLNTINLGQNTLGVQAASKRYFGKDVSSLTLSESAVLAGITKNPTSYNPILHPKHNKARRTAVLTCMKEQGYITNDDYTAAMKDKVYSRIQAVNEEISTETTATSYFTDALIEQVISDLKTKLGYTETQAYNALYSRGLTIETTQDSSMQKICDKIINNKKYYPKSKGKNSEPQASFVLMDQYTGEVKALCGGRGKKTASRTLNRATGITRQPGSTFKVLST